MSSKADSNGAAGCARWSIPQIDARMPGTGAQAAPGYDEGFARGRADALAAGRQEIAAQVSRLQQMMQSLARPFAELDDSVETELLTLVMVVAQQVIRHELTVRPEQVLGIIREAVALLPVATRELTLSLHPEDAALVREHMSSAVEEGSWRILEDAACERGGCVVSTDHARIDATIEQQLARIADAVLAPARGELQ